MPLYLVRWPDASCVVAHMENEDALVDALDEVGDPGCAIWIEYTGPLWIAFEPKVSEDDEIVVDAPDVGSYRTHGIDLRYTRDRTDAENGMIEHIMARALSECHARTYDVGYLRDMVVSEDAASLLAATAGIEIERDHVRMVKRPEGPDGRRWRCTDDLG